MALDFRTWIILLLAVSYPAATNCSKTTSKQVIGGRQSVIVSTSTVSVTELCAKLVNIAGACRRRRATWMDEPIVMTFHDDDHSIIDRLMVFQDNV